MVDLNIQVTREPWWQEGVAFTCTECGSCCGGEPGAVWVTDEEQQRIAQALCLEKGEFKGRFTRKLFGRTSLIEASNYDCIFLKSETKKCSIYIARPLQCSLFPFWPSVFESKESWERYARGCPGMNQGKRHTAEEIAERLLQAPWADL